MCDAWKNGCVLQAKGAVNTGGCTGMAWVEGFQRMMLVAVLAFRFGRELVRDEV